MSREVEQVIVIHEEVREALASGRGVVALETAVLTHGLPRRPWPQPPIAAWLRDPHDGLGIDAAWRDDADIHVETVRLMAEAVRAGGSVPAVIGMLAGTLHVGMAPDQLSSLANASSPAKLSARDLGIASSRGDDGGTTVAGTLAACALAAPAIRVMATGGIGGAHRGWNTTADISADLRLLAESPVCLVASGAKSILDIAATAEMLDTLAVPTIGYRTGHWPRFISPPCGSIACPWTIGSPDEAAAACRRHWGAFAQRSAVLLLNAPPSRWALADAGELDRLIAEEAASAPRDRGPDVTPHLLQRLVDRTGGRTLLANIALLLSNARLAGEIATSLARHPEPSPT